MNFTREPIIETIISPKEGSKLVVKNSKVPNAEEYTVDAVEVVSFGRAFFFRSLEKPKPFLVPVSDYEVFEVKETRVVLKNIAHERNIKIGGGREAPLKIQKELPQEKEELMSEEQVSSSEESTQEVLVEAKGEKRRDRRRRHRRRSSEREWPEKEKTEEVKEEPPQEVRGEGGGAHDETKVSSSLFSTLIPPPPTLISETIGRYKDKESVERTPLPEEVEGFPSEHLPSKNSESKEESLEFGYFPNQEIIEPTTFFQPPEENSTEEKHFFS